MGSGCTKDLKQKQDSMLRFLRVYTDASADALKEMESTRRSFFEEFQTDGKITRDQFGLLMEKAHNIHDSTRVPK